MEVRNISVDEQEKIIAQYTQLAFANLKRSIIQDLTNNRNESVILRKYKKEDIVNMLESPQKNEEKIRELSGFIYLVSPHYRRLVDYYSTILLYSYSVVPTRLPIGAIKKKDYKDCYYKVVNLCDKYHLEDESSKSIKIAVRDGVFFGISYETEDSYYIKHFPHTKYAKISAIEDGVYRFSLDMNYFSGKEYLLDMYGEDIKNNYWAYKGNAEKGIKGDKKKRWYEVPNGVVVKADETDPNYSFPVFTGLLLDILSIDDYKLLQKAKAEGDNYKVLSAKMDTDDDGVPKMDFELAKKYHSHICDNVPQGIGVIVSPFEIEDFSFQTSTASDRNNVIESINTFWQSAGTPSSLFGGGNISSQGAMLLATKPDEALAFSMLKQLERYFNMRIKKLDLKYMFKLKFSRLSIFNQDEYANRLSKASTYSMPVKLEYASALGMSPSDVLGMTYLEEEILGLSTKVWMNPPILNSTVSNNLTEAGRPSATESGKTLEPSGEQTRESGANDNR